LTALAAAFRPVPKGLEVPPGSSGRFEQFVIGPWQQADLVGMTARLATGLMGVLVAWIGCSATVSWAAQQAWTAVGIGAVVLSLTGVVGWLQAGMGNLHALEADVFAELRSHVGLPENDAVAAAPAPRPHVVQPTATVVSGPGMTLFHRPDCLFVQDKETSESSRTDAAVSLQPCVVCEP
jgi:hypothetical protein